MPSDGDEGIVCREYGEVRDVGLHLQFVFSGEGGVDEGDTSTSVDKERGVSVVDSAFGHQGFGGGTGGNRDSMSETNCFTWVVTKLACLFAELLGDPAWAAFYGRLGKWGTCGSADAGHHGVIA